MPVTTLSNRQTFALVVLFVVTSLGFIQLDGRRALDPIKDGLQAIVSPAAAALSSIAPGRGDDSALERELAVVKAERDQMAAQIAEYKAQEREIEDLRLQAQLKKDSPTWKVLPARVIASDPTGQELFVTIDKGSRDKVGVGMAVTARGKNYIGVVTEVGDRTARVTLLIDRTQAVAAKLESGSDGIVYGMSRIGSWLEMRHLNPDARVVRGESVVTADNPAISTARVPGDLLIGRVDKEIEPDGQGDSRSVEVVPLIDYEKLEVVTVVQSDGG
jgi:rod shape-determining protein MreC